MKLALGSLSPFHVFYAPIVESSSAGIFGQLVHSLMIYIIYTNTNLQSHQTTTKYVFYIYQWLFFSMLSSGNFLNPLRLGNFLFKSLHAEISFQSIEICALNDKRECVSALPLVAVFS